MRQCGRAARRNKIARRNREQRLPDVFHFVRGEQRIAGEDRADVQFARHFGGGDHIHHARRGAHARQIHAPHAPVRDRAAADAGE